MDFDSRLWTFPWSWLHLSTVTRSRTDFAEIMSKGVIDCLFGKQQVDEWWLGHMPCVVFTKRVDSRGGDRQGFTHSNGVTRDTLIPQVMCNCEGFDFMFRMLIKICYKTVMADSHRCIHLACSNAISTWWNKRIAENGLFHKYHFNVTRYSSLIFFEWAYTIGPI